MPTASRCHDGTLGPRGVNESGRRVRGGQARQVSWFGDASSARCVAAMGNAPLSEEDDAKQDRGEPDEKEQHTGC